MKIDNYLKIDNYYNNYIKPQKAHIFPGNMVVNHGRAFLVLSELKVLTEDRKYSFKALSLDLLVNQPVYLNGFTNWTQFTGSITLTYD